MYPTSPFQSYYSTVGSFWDFLTPPLTRKKIDPTPLLPLLSRLSSRYVSGSRPRYEPYKSLSSLGRTDFVTLSLSLSRPLSPIQCVPGKHSVTSKTENETHPLPYHNPRRLVSLLYQSKFTLPRMRPTQLLSDYPSSSLRVDPPIRHPLYYLWTWIHYCLLHHLRQSNPYIKLLSHKRQFTSHTFFLFLLRVPKFRLLDLSTSMISK